MDRALALERQFLFQDNADWQMPAEVQQRVMTSFTCCSCCPASPVNCCIRPRKSASCWPCTICLLGQTRACFWLTLSIPQTLCLLRPHRLVTKSACCMQVEHLYSQYVSEEVAGNSSGRLTVSVRGGSCVLAVAAVSRMSVPDFACLWTASHFLYAVLARNRHVFRK